MTSNKSLLTELKYFVNGVPNLHRGLPPDVSSQLVKCSLTLLEELSTSREVILEYFSMVFDESVKNYVAYEREPQGTPPDDELVVSIQEALENLVTKGPAAWAPLISSWSLRILGTLSSKYSRGRVMDIGSSCTLWLGSNAMRCLLGLAALCFSKLYSKDTDDCIATLLSTFVQNSPHFDWVVARLGGCFPLKVISKILQCGLRGFVGNANSTLDSEVGILGYLSFAYESDLKFALKEMLQTVLIKNVASNQPQISTIPYLLHLCGMSEILLQPIINVFLDLFNDSLIPSLIDQAQLWPQNFKPQSIIPSLTSLALKLKSDATKTIITLAKIADDHAWCQDLLESILQELELLVWEMQSCQLLNDLIKDSSTELLWQSCVSSNLMEQQTAIRLLLLASPQSPFIFHQTVAKLLENSYVVNNNGFGALVRLLPSYHGTPEPLQIKPGIEMALERLMLGSNRKRYEHVDTGLNVLKNLVSLIKLEKLNTSTHLNQSLVTTTTNECISKILIIQSMLLKRQFRSIRNHTIDDDTQRVDDADTVQYKKLKSKPFNHGNDDAMQMQTEKEQIHLIANLLDLLEVGGSEVVLGMVDVIKLAQLTVTYFFWSLYEKNPVERSTAVNRAYSMLTRQCTIRKSSRTLALRELLEGAFFAYSDRFGAHSETNYEPRKETVSLMKLNQNHCSIRSILHAGIIGSGLQAPMDVPEKLDPEMQQIFLGAIAACCKSEDIPTTIDGFSTVSLLLVEMVSTDVMYNGLPWPDEDFTKVTMERDLQIRRTFTNAPILWGILGLVATYRPAICFTSVLLRALCASVLNQWRAKTVDKYQGIINNVELYDTTKKLLEVMSMGQLLPPPLSYLHTVIDYLDAPEISVVLKECIWNYMKENVPSPVLYGVDSTGLHWRDSVAAKPYPIFVDPLRNIMQRKLPQLGTFYHQMFVISELSENVPKKN